MLKTISRAIAHAVVLSVCPSGSISQYVLVEFDAFLFNLLSTLCAKLLQNSILSFEKDVDPDQLASDD